MMNQYPAKPMMDQMAQYGRYGDSMLVHMNPVEVAGIASLSPTGSLTINPVTGQPEAFLPLLFGGLGSLLKLSPLMTGVLSGVGTAAVTGDLRRGLLSGLTAGFAGAAGDAMELGNLGSAAEAGSAAADTVVGTGTETLEALQAGAYGVDAGGSIIPNVPGAIDTTVAGSDALYGAEALADLTTTTPEIASQVAADAAPTFLDQAREAIPDVLKERPDFLKNVAPDFAPTFTQALVPAAIGQSTLEQMDVQEDFERAARARMAEAEEKKAQSTADLQFGYAMAQPDAPRGRSPMRDRMDRYIRDYGTDLYAASGGQMPGMQAGGQANGNSQYQGQGQGSGAGAGAGAGAEVVTSDDLGPLVVTPTPEEAAVLAAAEGNTALSPEDQQILEGYYRRYDQERQARDAQITDTGSEFDLGTYARGRGAGQFGYTPQMGLGGIDPVTIQAGLRGDYTIRPPDDYMPGFEAEFSYFQDDPNAPIMPYRGYRPTTGGITSEGDYFDPILDRGSYKRKLAEYYTTLASYGLGEGSDDDDVVGTNPPPGEDDGGGEETQPPVTNGEPDAVTPGIGKKEDANLETPDESGGVGQVDDQDLVEERIKQLMDRGMTREEAIANQNFAIASGYDLNKDGVVTDAEYRESIGSVGSGADAPEGSGGAGDVDMSNLPPELRDLIESGQIDLNALGRFSGFSGLSGNYGLAGSSPATPPQTTTPPPPTNLTAGAPITGAVAPANRGRRKMSGGGDVSLRSSLGEVVVPGGGIAEVETQFTARPERAEMPTEDEVNMLEMAVMGKDKEGNTITEKQQDMIVSAFTDKYGPEVYAMLRSEILRSIMPDAQTEGMIRGSGGGMDDKVPGMIGAEQPVAVSPGEFIVPADVVSDLGDGSSDSGADELYAMMERVRKARGGNGEQPPAINARRNMPA